MAPNNTKGLGQDYLGSKDQPVTYTLPAYLNETTFTSQVTTSLTGNANLTGSRLHNANDENLEYYHKHQLKHTSNSVPKAAALPVKQETVDCTLTEMCQLSRKQEASVINTDTGSE